MKKWRNPTRAAAILSCFLILAACSGQNGGNAESENPAASPSDSTVNTPDTANPPASSSPDESDAPSPEGSKRPDTRSFDLFTKDGYQPNEAKLQQGTGYSLYIFDGFTFDAAAGRLSLVSDSNYNVIIEPLPSEYSLESLRKQGDEELAKFGEVQDYSGELVEHPLGYAELYLQASGAEGIKDYMIWKSQSGKSYLFRLSNPKGEAAAQFAEPVQISLSTVEADPS
ncbi:hypothetical protein [Paenibacillus nasutitermitis]|uniref:Lipoprotein n=1 Tax=Paenibacillus nasutitermitis TaxID=1652958 RepID=A0A917DYC6_9BACL|nr:hypothetical protein [Paenibacillus nasutitermitis]GGD80564.1 hypothetical protein GCM10010911_43370 [Paenibacillus nasutitermitis]